MKILVTGAGGFIGRYTAIKLNEMGYDVVVNDFVGNLLNYSEDFTVIGFDFSEYSNFAKLPKDIDIIFLDTKDWAKYILAIPCFKFFMSCPCPYTLNNLNIV